jgi:lipopolysaccharide export system permease protein
VFAIDSIQPGNSFGGNTVRGLTCAMRLHDRYLFRELLTPLAYCLGGFLVFWVSFFFFTELEHMQESKLHALDCVEYAAAMTPGFFVLALPIALLLALLYALTHHARYNEITALRAAGLSLWRLCTPYFVIGIVATGVYFALNEILVPRGNAWSAQILARYVQNDGPPESKTRFYKSGFRNDRAHRIWQIEEFDSITATMVHPNVSWTMADGSWHALIADHAVYTNGSWTFFSAKLFAQTTANDNLVPLYSTNVLAMPDFDETPKQIARNLKFSDAEDLLKSRSADIPLSELWPYLRDNPETSAREKARLLTKLQGRLAAPWTCLVVVFIAIPFGAAPGRRNLFFGVAGSIFICFAFFILQQVGLALGMNGYLPPWLAAWLPNLFFAALGIFLTLRIR